MQNLLKAELKKLFHSLPLKIAMTAMLALSFVTALSSMSYKGSPLREELEIALGGYEAFLASLRDTPLLILLGIIALGVVVCSDFDNRTIQAEIYAGHGRSQIVISKFIAMSIGYTVLLLPYPVGRLIFQSAFYGFGPMVSASTVFKLLPIFAVYVLIGLALASIGILLAFTIRKTVVVIASSIVLVLLGGNALLSFGGSIPPLGDLLAKTPLGLGKWLFAMDYAAADLWLAAAVCAATIILMCLLTSAAFGKAELK